MIEIDFSDDGGPYSTIYVEGDKWGLETPGGVLWRPCPEYLLEALRRYKDEQ